MKQHNHAVVWIDHHEARVYHFTADDAVHLVLHPHDPHVHIHHKANSIGSGHPAEDQHFLHAVAEAIGSSHAVLVTGPGLAKTALMKHVATHDPDLMKNIVGIETVDHPTDGELLKFARTYFHGADLLTVQKL